MYLTQGDSARYCHSCGRIIGQRRANTSKASSTEVKYCSDKCKHNKPKAFDRSIEAALLALLQGEDPNGDDQTTDAKPTSSKAKRKVKKGDPRIIVTMSEIETAVFGNLQDPEKIYGRNKNRAKRGLPEPDEWQSIDMVDGPQHGGHESAEESNQLSTEGGVPVDADMVTIQNHIRPSQLQSDVNGSIGGEKGWQEKIEETPEMLQKRREGQKRAEQRELIRNAARRAIAFGLVIEEVNDNATARKKPTHTEQSAQMLRKCEALMSGSVVDPSFAKGDWSVRWREE